MHPRGGCAVAAQALADPASPLQTTTPSFTCPLQPALLLHLISHLLATHLHIFKRSSQASGTCRKRSRLIQCCCESRTPGSLRRQGSALQTCKSVGFKE